MMRGLGGHACLRGRYELESELGRGAGGIVYSARDREAGRFVAIKVGLADTAASGCAFPAGLVHEHLVTVHERGTHEDVAYMVMERIDGSNLVPYCTRDTRLPLAVMLSVMTGVAQALDFLHKRGIVHGDVKPSNVLYSRQSDTAKLADLSAACISGAQSRGTRAYLAPEQVCGAAASAAADQFAFGVTLYQLACGVLPFAAASLPQLCASIVREKHAASRSHDAALPAELDALFDRVLAKDPVDRFGNMECVAAEVRTLRRHTTRSSKPRVRAA